ncbi:MAG TPA: UDP-glucose/GDP-mannose dehydrogenase family protein [Acidimicrobiia bacterium]|nr:UDP-glucose/GDP-mannose dehydrogenase family protein [Acidimicrobiia bacterium]
MTRLGVVGTGYVGLVTGACLASAGHQVTCVDIDASRVHAIRDGMVPFYEPGLAELLRSTLGKNLSLTTDLKQAVTSSEITFIAVGTPSRDDGSIDLDQVINAVSGVGEVLRSNDDAHIVVVKSTVVPGSTDGRIRQALTTAAERQLDGSLALVVNPEFLTEGTAIHDFMHPDRLVVGSSDLGAAMRVADLFGPTSAPLVVTNPSTAEMIKYASNTLLATLISFSNEIEEVGTGIGGVDAGEVMRAVRLSRYLTDQGQTAAIGAFLEAGCGFGGSCLPKDTAALVAAAQAKGVEANLLSAVLDINGRRPGRLVDLVRREHPTMTGLKVTVLGLAFKPDTDDVRMSPAFPLISLLLEEGAVVATHDPVVAEDSIPHDLRKRVRHSRDLAAAIEGADAVVIVTRWDDYLGLPAILQAAQQQPLVIDGRRMLAPESVARYRGTGYPGDGK